MVIQQPKAVELKTHEIRGDIPDNEFCVRF
jgi:hypothetical protein